MKTTVVITKYFTETGAKKDGSGTWARTDFVTEDGQRFKTFDGQIASALSQLKGVQVELEYELKESGQYVNNMITGFQRLDGGTAPVASAAAPVSHPTDDRQKQINRSAGLARAIEFCSVGSISVVEELDTGGLFLLANTFARFFETGEFGASYPSSEGAVAEPVEA